MRSENTANQQSAIHPSLSTLCEVLAAYTQERPITTRCTMCGQPLVMTDEQVFNSRWIGCGNGCTTYIIPS